MKLTFERNYKASLVASPGQLPEAIPVGWRCRVMGQPGAASGEVRVLFTFNTQDEASFAEVALRHWYYTVVPQASTDRDWRHYSVRQFVPSANDLRSARPPRRGAWIGAAGQRHGPGQPVASSGPVPREDRSRSGQRRERPAQTLAQQEADNDAWARQDNDDPWMTWR